MKSILSRLGLVLSLTVLLGWAGTARADVPELNGTWEGSLDVLPDAPGAVQPLPQFVVRIVIQGNAVKVFANFDKTFVEVKPGAFKILRFKSNALIAAIDSGQDNEGTWIETWNFTVTAHDAESLRVVFGRAVHNEDLPADSDHKTFVVAAMGTLRRTAP